jgi:hypothetical protein
MSEAIAAGAQTQVAAASISRAVDIASTRAFLKDNVKLLGIIINSTLLFDKHITSVVRGINYHTHALRNIRPIITADVARRVPCSMVL